MLVIWTNGPVEVALQPQRQRLTMPRPGGSSSKAKSVALDDNKLIREYGLKDGDSLIVKDLGPQISWRAVFTIEYLGPLLIHQIMFLWLLNGGTAMPSFTQTYKIIRSDC